jgi:hypothetical protein
VLFLHVFPSRHPCLVFAKIVSVSERLAGRSGVESCHAPLSHLEIRPAGRWSCMELGSLQWVGPEPVEFIAVTVLFPVHAPNIKFRRDGARWKHP